MTHPKTQEPKLADILFKLELQHNKLKNKLFKDRITPTRTNRRAFNTIVFERFDEVILTIKRIITGFSREIEITQALEKLEKYEDQQDAAVLSEIDNLSKQLFSTIDYLKLDIKFLYILVSEVKDIFKDNLKQTGKKIDLKELERISLIRHKFITHITDGDAFKQSVGINKGTHFHSAKENIEVMFTPLVWKTNRKLVGFKKLKKEAEKYIPELEELERDYDVLKILYRKLNNITDSDLDKRARKMISKYGTYSEPPVVLAAALLKCFKDYIR